MKQAAVGIRVHSGWGAVVALAGKPGSEEVIERSKLVIIDANGAGGAQPYHFAASMKLSVAEKHIAACSDQSALLALEALRKMVGRLREGGFRVAGSAILMSSARPLPELPQILASHPLIHTAEGELFRQAFRRALDELRVPVTGIRERELDACSLAAFGKAAAKVCAHIEGLGRSVGPPWTQDQKSAALAAAIVLARRGYNGQ